MCTQIFPSLSFQDLLSALPATGTFSPPTCFLSQTSSFQELRWREVKAEGDMGLCLLIGMLALLQRYPHMSRLYSHARTATSNHGAREEHVVIDNKSMHP